eukprot:g7041.t1
MGAHSRLAVLTAATQATSAGALRLSYDRATQSLLLKKAKLDLGHDADADTLVLKLDPTENEHPNPFFARDWWPHPEDPNKQEDDDPEKAETKETEDANAESMNSDGLAVQASYQAEASKKAAEKDALDEEKKKIRDRSAEEEATKAEEAKKAAEAAKKKAEETKKSALKALEENHNADLTKARNQWGADVRWFNNARRSAAHNFRNAVRRAPWWKRIFTYLRQRGQYRRKMSQIYRQFHPKRANWIKARREFHKCRAQQRQFDWQIKQAKAKYEQARGVPETKLLGCFEDKPRRAMKWIRGRFSIKRCAKKCGARGFTTMAIQYSWECFCGRGNQHENRPCTQDPEERKDPKNKCGGGWRNSVYKMTAASPSSAPSVSSFAESSTPSTEYDFEAEKPNSRRDRSSRAPRIRQRRKAYRVNLLGYNGGGVGESEVFQTRNRLIGGQHRSILGQAPAIDAALGTEVFYPSKAILSDAYGKGHVNRQASSNNTAYEVLWVRGAAITVYNERWVDAIRSGKYEVWGSDRIIVLRLPRISLLAAYAPALGGNQGDNDAEWYQFQQRMSAALDWGRRVSKAENSIFRAGNRPIYEYTDNFGCVGDPDSRLRRGYSGATTGKFGMPETSTRGLYALLLHDQVRMVCANSLHPQPVGVCPWGGNYPAGRATHFSRLQKRWRELDVWWCSANSTDKVQNVSTVDFGLGTDHLQKLITVDVELQWQQENSTRRAERDAATAANDSAKPPPWKPLWRASPEARFNFSRHVENAVRDSIAAPNDEPLLTEVPHVLRYFRPILETSCDARLDAYNRSHDVTQRQKLLDEWAWTRWQMRKWPADSVGRGRLSERNLQVFRALKEFEGTQKSDFNVDEHCNKQRQLKRQKKARAHEFDPEEAAAHFKRVADNAVLPRLDIIREVVSPLPAQDVDKLCAPFTGAELYEAVHASKKISRQSDAFGDDVQLCRALDVDAWDAIADLINPSWLTGFENMSEGLEADLLNAVVVLHFKKGDPKLLDNYRGLVNKTIFSKVLTAALARRFEAVLEGNGLYSPSQLGFRSGVQGVELIFVVRRMAEDIRLLYGANSEVSRLVTLLEMDIQKAYPSFPLSVFRQILVSMGLEGSNYLKAVELLHLGTRYQVQTAKGLSAVYLLPSGFGEGDRRSPGDFAWSYEICIQLFRRIISNADPAQRAGIRLYAPRARLAVEQRREILRRAHPRSTDLVCIECRDVEYADDTSFPGSLSASLTQYASWQQQGATTGVRDNPKKTDLALLDEPGATAANRFLGNWLDLEEDTNRRCAKMAFGLHEMSCISGAAASATEMRVNVVARVRSRGTFGCEARDYETDPDATRAELSAARLHWLDHFQSANPKSGLCSFNDWCHASTPWGPTFSACDTGERISKIYEEVRTQSESKCACIGGCGFSATSIGNFGDDRFSSWQEETEATFDCRPVARIDNDPVEFYEHPATGLERHELICPAVSDRVEAWHVAPPLPELSLNAEVADRIDSFAHTDGVLGKLHSLAGAGSKALLTAANTYSRAEHDEGRFDLVLQRDHHAIIKELHGFDAFTLFPPESSPDRYDPSLPLTVRNSSPPLTGILCCCEQCGGKTLRNVRAAFVHMRTIKSHEAVATFREAFPPTKKPATDAGTQNGIRQKVRKLRRKQIRKNLTFEGLGEKMSDDLVRY